MSLITFNIDKELASGQASTEAIINHLLTEHYSGLLRFATNYLNDSDLAEDVVQRTIIKVTRIIHQYEPHTNFKAWVYTIAFNEARVFLRKRQSRQRLKQLLGNGRSQTTLPSPEDETIQDERKRKLWQAVQKLKEKHRVPVMLRYLEGLSAGEIAQVLGVPVGTVYSRLHYAHGKLFGLLQADEVAA